MERKHGWIPDKIDQRDYLFKSIQKTPTTQLPNVIDMRKFMTTVEDQGKIGSCVANALVGAIEYLYVWKILKRYSCLKPRDYSRLFVYYWARQLDNIIDDGGCTIRSAIKTLVDYGVCRERTWSYQHDRWSLKPDEDATAEALKKRATDYYRVGTLDELFSALADGYPVTFGAKLYQSFYLAETGNIPIPLRDDVFAGNHAMLACGYNLDTETILVRNSWGTNWGINGYCEMPIKYFEPIGNLVQDCWVVRTTTND
jgi:C1A family cysteine protease